MGDFVNDNSGVKFEEELPLPYVKYDYGNWIIEFGDGKGNFKVCECFRESIKNHIEYNKKEHDKFYGEGSWDESFKKGGLGNYNMNWYSRYLQGYSYEINLCHRCNNKTPSTQYGNVYGGKFEKSFGWYIERRKWERNFDESERVEYENNEIRFNELSNKRNELVQQHSNEFGVLPEPIFRKTYEIEKECGKLFRKNKNYVENLVRGEFGYKPIGEMWVNETILYKLVKEMFPKSVVIHHYRGSELEGLEIDVFIKDKKIGFEYNGLQHYKPIKHFGGEKSLKKTKERDKRKIELCESLGIELHIIKYDETISKNLIKSRLNHT